MSLFRLFRVQFPTAGVNENSLRVFYILHFLSLENVLDNRGLQEDESLLRQLDGPVHCQAWQSTVSKIITLWSPV